MEKNDELEEIVENKAEQKDEQRGKSIAAMVLGIVSVVFVAKGLISIPCGVLAIIFGNKKRKESKMAKAGFILGIVGLAIYTLISVLGVLLGIGLIGMALSLFSI